MFDLLTGTPWPWCRHKLGLACWARVGGRWRLCVHPAGISPSRSYAWTDCGDVVLMVAAEAVTPAWPEWQADGLVCFGGSVAGWQSVAAHLWPLLLLA